MRHVLRSVLTESLALQSGAYGTMKRAERFVDLYNQLDRYLRAELSTKDRSARLDEPFSAVLAKVASFNRTVRAHESDIRDMASLRNAIVHTSGRFQERYFAEPYADVVTKLEILLTSVTKPPTAETVGVKNPATLDPTEKLGTALRLMREKGYSQVLTWNGAKTQLLSVIGIKNWLAEQVEEEFAIIEGAAIADVLSYEPQQTHKFVSRTSPVEDLRAIFAAVPSLNAERAQALIVTNSGKNTEKAIGLITPSDIVSQQSH